MRPNETAVDVDLTTRLGIDQGSRPRHRWSRIARWVAVATGIVAVAALMVSRRLRTHDEVAYRTESIRHGDLSVSVTATGALEPLTQVNVGTEISGIVEAVLVDYNDRVRTGQALARLNTDKLDAQARQAQASLQVATAARERARATVAEVENEFTRLEALRLTDATSIQAWEAGQAALRRAEAEVVSADAQIAQAEATVAAIQSDRRKATIRSPIDGVVLDRQVDPGQTVAASFQTPVLFVLARDLSAMTLSVDVDEADVGRVAVGQPATFTVDAYPDLEFESEVAAVRSVPKTVSGVVTYEAVLRVDNAELLLKPGMTATATITVTGLDDVLLVPNAALRFSPPEGAVPDEADDAAERSVVRSLIPMPRRPDGARRPSDPAGARSQGRVWVLEGGVPTPVDVTVGLTDGTMTHLVAGDVGPDTPVIVDIQTPSSTTPR
ncbi:MAG: efflux RND transporter periplasmic adaptor subunit [Gemmatimonadales bacterium]